MWRRGLHSGSPSPVGEGAGGEVGEAIIYTGEYHERFRRYDIYRQTHWHHPF